MKVMILLDYANLAASANSLAASIDYEALHNYLANEVEGREAIVSYAYVPIDPRNEHAMDRVISRLTQAGFLVRSKVGTIRGDTYKCDFDVELTIDAIGAAIELKPDVVVIVSGDGDFVPIARYLREKGIRVEAASFDTAMSKQLANQVSGYIQLDALVEPSDYGTNEPYSWDTPDYPDFDSAIGGCGGDRDIPQYRDDAAYFDADSNTENQDNGIISIEIDDTDTNVYNQ